MYLPRLILVLKPQYLGYALAVAPVFWDKLTDKEKSNVETWLGNSINEKKLVGVERTNAVRDMLIA